MRIKNKKGIGLEWYLLIAAVIFGFSAFFFNFLGPYKIIGNYIGEYQFNIMKTANEAEKASIYIDLSSKYALQQSIYELGQKGGIAEVEIMDDVTTAASPVNNKECGKYYGYQIWYETKKDCVDYGKVQDSLIYIFNNNINNYLLSSPFNIPLDNYNYELAGSLEITGKAIHPIKFDILKDEARPAIKEAAKTVQDNINLIDFTGTGLCAKGSECKLTEEAYLLLQNAQKSAEKNKVNLEVYSAYRSKESQINLWGGRTAERYAQRYPDAAVRAKYVCNPNGKYVCPHLTGNVIDVRLKEKSKFKETEYWNLLQKIMSQAGWVRYSNEGWHFECCGTERYQRAKAKGVTEIA